MRFLRWCVQVRHPILETSRCSVDGLMVESLKIFIIDHYCWLLNTNFNSILEVYYIIIIYSHRKKHNNVGRPKKKPALSSGRPAWRAFQTKATALRQTATASGWVRPALAAPFTRTAGGTTWKFCGNSIVIHSPAVNSEHPKIACALNMFKPVLPISWWDSLVLKVIPLRIFFFRRRMRRSPWWHALRPHWPGEGSFGVAGFRWHWTTQVPSGTCRWDCR